MLLYCIAVLRWCYKSLFVNYYRSVCEWLLVSGANDYSFRMQTTIGSYIKPLLVWGQMNSAVSLYPSHYPPRFLGKCFVSLRDIRGEVIDRSQFPRSRVFAFSSRWSSFLSYWDEDAHLSLSFPIRRKLGTSYRCYKRSVTLLLYMVNCGEKRLCVGGVFEPVLVAELTSTTPFTDQYW